MRVRVRVYLSPSLHHRYITEGSAARYFPLAMRSILTNSANLRFAAEASFSTYGMFDLMNVVEVNHAEWSLRDMPEFYNQLLWDGEVVYNSELRPSLPLGYGRCSRFHKLSQGWVGRALNTLSSVRPVGPARAVDGWGGCGPQGGGYGERSGGGYGQSHAHAHAAAQRTAAVSHHPVHRPYRKHRGLAGAAGDVARQQHVQPDGALL
jgi:hypothetical protein